MKKDLKVESKVKTILKWAGGKTQLLPEIIKRLPLEIHFGHIQNYCEPFLGGGAVFIYIIENFNIEKAYLIDINEELILFYQVIKNDPELFIKKINNYKNTYIKLTEKEKEIFYYQIRNEYNQTKNNINFNVYNFDWIERAAQMLFLNKTCYNGLYRQNSKGEFNVPFGKYEKPEFFSKENVYNVSKYLQKAELICADFEIIEKFVDSSFFVYFDPPYRPLTKTSSFTSYTKYDFSDKDQIRLAKLYYRLNNKNVKLMLSNSNPKSVNDNDDFFDKLYAEFKIERIYANRMINCNGSNRGKISELIITNY